VTLAPAKTKTRCLSCGGLDLRRVLSLGATPLANSFVDPGRAAEPEARYPLELVFCAGCALLQLSERVDPAILFRDYVYMTGTSSTMARHHESLASAHVARLSLGEESLVVDIASNDGSLLKAFAGKGVRTLGIEPAANLARVARDAGIDTIDRFFDVDCALSVVADFGHADLVCANNVLAHVPDLGGFLKGCRLLLGTSGVLSVEVPWLAPLVENLEYDTIYHEHLSYFSVLALRAAFSRAGLAIFDLEHLPVHGGTVRVLARPGQSFGAIVDETCALERQRGLDRAATFLEFAARVERSRAELRALLKSLKKQGRRVAAYGAPAKGNTLLNTCGIGPDLVEYTVDRNPLKVGKLTPGMRIPVMSRDRLDADPPDYLLILPWNLTDEIMQQESEFRRKGGRFVIPIPEPRVVA
jgi:SAM-dependent methyltransferase